MPLYLFNIEYGDPGPITRHSRFEKCTLMGVPLTDDEIDALTAGELRQLLRSYKNRWRDSVLVVIRHVDGDLGLYNEADAVDRQRYFSSDVPRSYYGSGSFNKVVAADNAEEAERQLVHWLGFSERIHGTTLSVRADVVRLEFDGRNSRKAKKLLHAAGFSWHHTNWARSRSDEAVAAGRQVIENIHALRE